MFPGVVEGSGALKALGTRAVGGSGTLGPAPSSWGSAVHSLKQSGCIPRALQDLSDLPSPPVSTHAQLQEPELLQPWPPGHVPRPRACLSHGSHSLLLRWVRGHQLHLVDKGAETSWLLVSPRQPPAPWTPCWTLPIHTLVLGVGLKENTPTAPP